MCGSDRAGRLGGEADWSRMRVDIGIMTFIMHRLVRAGGKDGDVAGAERGFAFVSDPHGFAVEHDDARLAGEPQDALPMLGVRGL